MGLRVPTSVEWIYPCRFITNSELIMALCVWVELRVCVAFGIRGEGHILFHRCWNLIWASDIGNDNTHIMLLLLCRVASFHIRARHSRWILRTSFKMLYYHSINYVLCIHLLLRYQSLITLIIALVVAKQGALDDRRIAKVTCSGCL